jgi:hypothetical protein
MAWSFKLLIPLQGHILSIFGGTYSAVLTGPGLQSVSSATSFLKGYELHVANSILSASVWHLFFDGTVGRGVFCAKRTTGHYISSRFKAILSRFRRDVFQKDIGFMSQTRLYQRVRKRGRNSTLTIELCESYDARSRRQARVEHAAMTRTAAEDGMTSLGEVPCLKGDIPCIGWRNRNSLRIFK